MVFEVLRRHVLERPENRALRSQTRWRRRQHRESSCNSRSTHLRQTEIENLHAAVGHHEDVFWLEIPMNDAFLVCGRKAMRDLNGVLDRLAYRERTTVQSLAQRFALEQLGDDVGGAAVLTDVMHREDVRVIQRRGGSRFLLKTRQSLRLCRQAGGQDLDGDVPAQAGIVGLIDFTHSARPDWGGNDVWAEPRAGSDHRRETSTHPGIGEGRNRVVVEKPA